ncbi:MAG: IPT/TIG domain-containing protein [Pyrinomonadaceae bacterium]
MKKNNHNLNFILKGRVVSNKDRHGIAGVTIKAVDPASKKESEHTISNEDGGFHFRFAVKDPGAAREVLLNLFDVNDKQLRGTEGAIPLKAGGEEAYVELTVDDEELQSHQAKIRTLKPRDGRVFPAEKLNEIFSAINQFGNTSKKYYMSGGMRPGLTCPFPEMNDYDNLLFDAWDTLRGEVLASDRFRNTLDTIAFSMSQRGGVKTEIDFKSRQWRGFVANGRANTSHASPLGWLLSLPGRIWRWLSGEKPETRGHARKNDDPMVSLESAALLMLAAQHVAGKDDRLSNHYRNVVLSQMMEFAAVAPIYRTAHSSLLGDVKSQSNLRTMIHYWGEDCGGGLTPIEDPTGRVIWDPSKFMEPEVELILGCLEEFINPPPTLRYEYRIDSMSPNNGCGGDTAILRGSGFVPGGEVRFVGPTLDSIVSATPTRWSDTEVEFVIPFGATYGPVSLYYPYRNGVVVCGAVSSELYIDVSAIPTLFVGGRPRIDSIAFIKNDAQFDPLSETVLPGEAVTLVYECTPNAPRRSVEVRESQIGFDNGQFQPSVEIPGIPGSNVLYQGFGGPARTSLTLPPTDYNRSTRILCSIALTNFCGDARDSAYFIVHRPATIKLLDIEVTQAIQFLKSDRIDPDEQRPDNSVKLIAGKRTLVRVFYSTNQLRDFNEGKSFGLDVILRGFRDGVELVSSPRPAINFNNLIASQTENVYSLRFALDRSANFLMPWNAPSLSVTNERGFVEFDESPLTLVAELSLRPFEPWVRDLVDPDRDELTIRGLNFNRAKPMQCVIVRVRHTGSESVNSDAPPEALCASVLRKISHAYPTDEVEVFVPSRQADREIDANGNLTGGELAPGWLQIVDSLVEIAGTYTADDDKVWCGMLHASILELPTLQLGDTVGTGINRFAAFPASLERPEIGMHEIGHALRLEHTDESSSGFPDYLSLGDDMSFAAPIGEIGIDVGSINPPDIDAQTFIEISNDFMFKASEDWPTWVSPFTFESLMNSFFARSASAGAIESSLALTRINKSNSHFLKLSGVIDLLNGDVKMSPSYHLPGKPDSRLPRKAVFSIRASNQKGISMYEIPLIERLNNREIVLVSQAVPFTDDISKIEIVRQGKVIFVRTRNKNKPVVGSLRLLSSPDGKWRLEWDVESDGLPFWCGVQLTCDDGENWLLVNKLAEIRNLSIDISQFGGGDACRFRVFVTDGFNTTFKETGQFSLPLPPPRIFPLNFDSETDFFAGVTYELRVQPVYILGVPHRTEIRWYLNKEEVGEGRQLSVNFKPGDQLLEVIPKGFDAAAIAFPITVKEKK